MGKKSREKMTNRTEKQRIKKPLKLNNTEDTLKIQKKMNKYLKVWNHIKKHMVIKAQTKDHKA